MAGSITGNVTARFARWDKPQLKNRIGKWGDVTERLEVRERLEWGEVATEDITAEEAGDCSGRTDMGAIPPPGYMQPSL